MIKFFDKYIQLFTVIILFASLVISIWGNLEQIKQNKIALYKQQEYNTLSNYRNDFILSSEAFLSLLERSVLNKESAVINKQEFEDEYKLSQKLCPESCVVKGYIDQYPINTDRIEDFTMIMSSTFNTVKSMMKEDNTYSDCYTISSKDLVFALQYANLRLSEKKRAKLPQNTNFTLEKYLNIYIPESNSIHDDFNKILIEKFKN